MMPTMAMSPVAMAMRPVAVAAPAPRSHFAFFLLAMLVVAGAVAYAAYEHLAEAKKEAKEEEAKEEEAEAVQKAKQASASAAKAKEEEKQAHAKLTPDQARARAKGLNVCNATKVEGATCHFDVQHERWYMHCPPNTYGYGCAQTCTSTHDRPRKYTPGTDGRFGEAATCLCPPGNHFKSANINTGCKAGTHPDGKEACNEGYYGLLCDQTGTYIDCGAKEAPPWGTQVGQKCFCKPGRDGATCQYETKRCTEHGDAGATPNADGSCTCSEGYLSEPNAEGTNATCNTCDAQAGYYKVDAKSPDSRCAQGTVCELTLFATGGGKAGVHTNSLGKAKSDGVGSVEVEYVQLHRKTGSSPCVARLTTESGCEVEVTLPTGKTSLTSFPLLQKEVADAVGAQTGRKVTAVAVGAQSDLPPAGSACQSEFNTQSGTDACPDPSGDVCAYYYTIPS